MSSKAFNIRVLSVFVFMATITVLGAEFVGNTVMKHALPMEKEQLRQLPSDSFHHKQAFSALEVGQDQFVVSEKHRSIEGWNISK